MKVKINMVRTTNSIMAILTTCVIFLILAACGTQSTGWSRAWKINFWARLGDGDCAHKLLRSLLTLVSETETIYGESGGGVYSNTEAGKEYKLDI